MPSRSPDKKWPLSIYLIKEELTGHVDIIDEPQRLDSHPLRKGSDVTATLYIKPARRHLPSWAHFFADALDLNALKIHAANASAVLLVTTHKRTIALTFGYGRSLLQPSAYEENFGLRVTLNAVDPNKIRTIDRKSLEAITTHTKEYASKDTDLGTFGINVDQDLLRAVTGTPTDPSLGHRIAGMDALNLTIPTTLKTLPTTIEKILTIAQQKTYQERFPWVDHLAEVRDKRQRDALDQRLLAHLHNGTRDRIWLAVPEAIPWEHVKGFTYGPGGRATTLYDDLYFADYLTGQRDAATLTLDHLKHDRITCIGTEQDQPLHTWTVRQCIYAELESEGTTYLFNNATWYRVNKEFVQQVNTDVDAIPPATVSLPAYQDDSEAAYNQRVAAADPTTFTLIDRKTITYGGGPSRIEFCDLYTAHRELIHVKRYGGSSVLSHLFAQGHVAGTLLTTDPGFRRKVSAQLPPGHQFTNPEERPNTANYEIVFGIISASTNPLTLPFFSKVMLRATHRALTGYGLRVSVAKIPNTAGR